MPPVLRHHGTDDAGPLPALGGVGGRGQLAEGGVAIRFVEALPQSSYGDLAAHLADFVTTNPADTVGNWKASFVKNVGETVTGYLENIIPDRTLGMVTMTLSEEEAA